jgi:cell wall-associated NlpC family hydrolase
MILTKKAKKRTSSCIIYLVMATVLTAPVLSLSLQTDFLMGFSGTPVAASIEQLAVSQKTGLQEEGFDSSQYDIADYSRDDVELSNRGTVIDNLLFGSVAGDSAEAAFTPPADMTFYEDSTTVYLHSGGINVRQYPSLDSTVLRQGYLGESFTRTGINPVWVRVLTSEGWTAYIRAEYIGDTAPTPTPTPIPLKKTAYGVYKASSPAVAGTLAESIAMEAKKYLGIRYRSGAQDPGTGFDCSGLTWYVFNRYGIMTPRGTDSYYNAGKVVDYSQIAVGDVIAWDTRKYDGRTTISHVGLYIGGGMMIHASSSNNAVMMTSVSGYQAYGCVIVSIHRFIT